MVGRHGLEASRTEAERLWAGNVISEAKSLVKQRAAFNHAPCDIVPSFDAHAHGEVGKERVAA